MTRAESVHSLPSCRFLSSFSGHVSAYNGAAAFNYVGTWAWDLSAGHDLQTTSQTVNGQQQNQTWIDLYNMGAPTAYFECHWDDVCQTDILVPPMRPFSIPADSTYEGMVVIDNTETQHWQYVFNGDKLHLVTDYYVAQRPASSNGQTAWFPLRMEYSGTQPPTIVNWTSVEIGTLSPSAYSIPASWNCQPDAFESGALASMNMVTAAGSAASALTSGASKAARALRPEAIPLHGMAVVARMMGSHALRAGLPRMDTCPPSSSSSFSGGEAE